MHHAEEEPAAVIRLTGNFRCIPEYIRYAEPLKRQAPAARYRSAPSIRNAWARLFKNIVKHEHLGVLCSYARRNAGTAQGSRILADALPRLSTAALFRPNGRDRFELTSTVSHPRKAPGKCAAGEMAVFNHRSSHEPPRPHLLGSSHRRSVIRCLLVRVECSVEGRG